MDEKNIVAWVFPVILVILFWVLTFYFLKKKKAEGMNTKPVWRSANWLFYVPFSLWVVTDIIMRLTLGRGFSTYPVWNMIFLVIGAGAACIPIYVHYFRNKKS